ncbi:hypothetical protein Rpal_3383 [Rhodopseudomonas palustris TIE-1]|uniref:hypothetical protein n=1 Tax=Rhodopseudomonas palustris TaxID=1076 RepID=UPI000164A532|nr:hypothetical protein [Rhodopseudomonas palustris]ACF01885.1 hypothetical protein Rpal_3383 [Rhodopseudomonas palustris TIE-1]
MITRFAHDVGELFGDVTAELFWSAATSVPSLLLLGAVAVAALTIAYLPIVARLWPAVEVYQRISGIVAVVAAAVLMFLVGFAYADQRAEVERLKDALTFKEFQLKSAADTAADAEQLRRAAEAETRKAKGQLDDYCKKFGCGDDRKPPAPEMGVRVVRRCDPPPGYVEWLRQLQRRPAAGQR